MPKKKSKIKNTPKGPIPVKSNRMLEQDEDLLWQRVKRTIEPQQKPNSDFEEFVAALGEKIDGPNVSPQPIIKQLNTKVVDTKLDDMRIIKMPSYSPPISVPKTDNLNAPIDDPTVKKLAKGRLPIEARIDLHGMSQAQAHRTLLNFIQDAYLSSMRIVLVITGKGRLTEGVLRNAVPNWLQESQFNTYVSGYRTSHISHGGTGALYVRIRKNKN